MWRNSSIQKWLVKVASRKIWFRKICATMEATYGWSRAQKWLYVERWSTTTKIIIFPLDVGIPSIKSIEIYIQTHVGMGLMLGGMHLGRSEIRWSPSLEGGNSIGLAKTHAYRSKICCRAKEVVETIDGCIWMEWSWAMTPCEFFLRNFPCDVNWWC